MSQSTTPSGDANRTARELLAAEYEREGIEFVPNAIRTDPILTTAEDRAVRAIVAALSRNAELEAKTALQMGVGDGVGQLFVYGDYESIKAAQAMALRLEALAVENKALRDGMLKLADKIAIYADDDEIDSSRLGRLAHFWLGQLTALARTPAKENDDG
ncbi:MAG: hypothetical protein V4636_19965 [Pseudomonadota bacterium]